LPSMVSVVVISGSYRISPSFILDVTREWTSHHADDKRLGK